MKPFFTKKAPYRESDVADQQAFGRNKKKPNQRDEERYDPPQRNDPPYRNDPPHRNDNYGSKVQYVAKEEHQDMRDSYKENKRQKKNRYDGQKPHVYQEKSNGNSNGNKQHHQSKQTSKKDEQEQSTQVQKIEQIQEVPLSQNEAKIEENITLTQTAKSEQDSQQVETQETQVKQETKPDIPEENLLKGTQDTSIQQQQTTSQQTYVGQSSPQQTQNQVIAGAQNQLPPPTITPQSNGFQQAPLVMSPQLQYQNPNPYMGGIGTLPPSYFVPQQYPYGPYQPYYPPQQNDPKQTLIYQQIYLGGHLISTQFPFTEEGIQSCHKFLTDLIQNNKK